MPEKHIQELETSRIVNETPPLGRTEGRNRDQRVTRRSPDIKNPLRGAGLVGLESGSDSLFQLRYGVEQVGDQAVVGDLEDRRLFVLVDRDDHLRVLHARQVLDGTGDAHRDVQLRGDDLAGLADLHVVRHETGVDRGAEAPTAAPSLSARA